MKYNGLITFAVGAAIGSVTAWIFAKRIYEAKYQEDVRSVKEAFARNAMMQAVHDDGERDCPNPDTDDQEQAPMEHLAQKPDLAEYAKKIRELGYTTYGSITEEPEDQEQPEAEPPSGVTGAKEGLTHDTSAPYVISPEQFGEFDDYDQESLTYYADHILTDSCDRIVEDVEQTVGFESLAHFGEYDEDSVYVRNDRLKMDFEILRDQREYSKVLEYKPYLRED